MDPFTLSLWVLRLFFVALIYLFFFVVIRLLWRDIRAAVRASASPLGRLFVIASPRASRPRAARYRSTPSPPSGVT